MHSPDPLLARIDQEIAQRIAAQGSAEDEEALRLEGSFIDFVEAAWPHIDSSSYMSNWAITGLAEHLEAVANGEIKRLLVNYPPRAGKTTLCSIAYPAWVWAQRERTYLKGPQVKFLCGSYGHSLSLLNSNNCRRLITSPFYQSMWGNRFSLRDDQNTKLMYDTSTGGSRIAASVGSSLLGLGYDICVVDDPHDTAGIESEADRETVWRWFSEVSSTRRNHPKNSAVVVVMQRLHELDVSGRIMTDSPEGDWTHFCVPAEFEAARCCQTGWQTDGGYVTWTDPRALDADGEPLLTFPDREPRDAEAAAILQTREGLSFWPERFGPSEIASLKASLGPYLAAGRLAQSPQPKGGGLFKPEYWQVFDHKAANNVFPPMSFKVASLDGAFTSNQSNDPSALTIWGIFQPEGVGGQRVLLMHAWRKHLELHGRPEPRLPGEIPQVGDTEAVVRQREANYRRRVGHQFGLVEAVRESCLRFAVDILLIEKAASGISVAQELQRLYAKDGIVVMLVPPKGDKVSRALAVQPMFAQNLIYAPRLDWADDLVIAEMAQFPFGARDDLTDSATQALGFLRRTGRIVTDDEVRAEQILSARYQPARKRIYPV
jgi:predicted phage terminase large subunit-like protein